MTNQQDSIASELVRWMEIPGKPQVFALGNFARQVTFASQQARAFNLIWALFKENRLTAGQSVAVVGAGLGGLTAAVAALAKECYVDLFEYASQPCPLQRGNDIRFIHPNILRWPEDGSERESTDFPFLNWTAANVRSVIKQIDLQWNMRASKNNRLRRFFNYRVNRLYTSPTKLGPQRPWLSANRAIDGMANAEEPVNGATPGYLEFAYDCVILAVGFGEERSIAGVPFLSYWENDSLHQETGRGKRSVLVSGCGDGGLIDALRLRLQNFDHAEFVREFLNIAESGKLVAQLQSIETELRSQAASADISLQLQDRYNQLSVPQKIEDYFRHRKRSDTTVTLNSPTAGPLSFKASLLNRYATYLAMRYADLHYLSGRVTAERSEAGGIKIALDRDDIGLRESGPFDVVIVRHGPENVIGRLVPQAAISEMKSWWETKEDITTQQHWQLDDTERPHQFFRQEVESEGVPSPEGVLDLALATFDSAYRTFRRDSDVQSVAVGEHNGKASFIVNLKAGSAPRQAIHYAGSVLVQYVTPPLVSSSQPSAPGRRLSIGVGIYNYNVQARLEHVDPDGSGKVPSRSDADPSPRSSDSYASTIGTLGCFAQHDDGGIHLITASPNLGFNNKAETGDLVYVEGETPQNGKAVATVCHNKFLPTVDVTSGSEAFGIGVASARLQPGVIPDYDPLTPAWQIKSLGEPNVGDRVAKIGRTSTLTTGTVDEVNLTISLTGIGQQRLLVDDCIRIKGDNDSNFSLPGDAGAIVVREDGAVLGMIIGTFPGNKDVAGSSVAILLKQKTLDDLNLRILRSDGTPISSSHKPRKKKGPRSATGKKAK